MSIFDDLYHNLSDPEDFYNQCVDTHNKLELKGEFNADENENESKGALPIDDYVYIKRGPKNWVKRKFYTALFKAYSKKINKIFNTQVVGKENKKGVKGAIVTCNHISYFDSLVARTGIGFDSYFIADEFNNFPGFMGELARNVGYLPVSSDHKIMRKLNDALEIVLTKKKKKVLIYPEQSMWRDYEKPRPLKNGAYHYAVKFNVPILPLFITLSPSGVTENGRERKNFTLHILPPIYPKENLSNKENLDYLKAENFRLWKECYEQTYNKKLVYTTIDQSKLNFLPKD